MSRNQIIFWLFVLLAVDVFGQTPTIPAIIYFPNPSASTSSFFSGVLSGVIQ